MSGSKLRIALLSLVLLLIAAGSLYSIVVAQDSAGQTYLPIAVRNGVLTTPGGPPSTGQETPLPTETAPPGSTPTPTPPPGSTPTAVPPPGSTPTVAPPPGSTPTVAPPPGSTPTVAPTDTPPTCEQYGETVQRSRRFGVQMYTNTQPGSQFFDSLVVSKAGWVRVITPWGNTERQNTTPDQYDWSWVDRELDAGNHLDAEMIGTIGFAPAWAAEKTNGPIDEEDMPEFLDFVRALVERYDGDGIDDAPCGQVVTYWELYNEPDNIRNWGHDAIRYARMLEQVYPVIKAANPNAQVLFGGVAHDHFTDQGGIFLRGWTDLVLQAGAGPYFDYMNFHIFAAFWQERASSPPGLKEKVEEFRAIMAANNVDKPIMITETGGLFRAEPSPETWRNQANIVYQLFAQALATDVEVTIWWMLYDLDEVTRHTWYPGLVTSDTPPVVKPSFDAFKRSVDLLDTAEYVRQFTAEELGHENAVTYEFVDSAVDRRIYVSWVDFEGTGTLRVPGRTAFVHDIYGGTLPIIDSADGAQDGWITIELGLDSIIAEVYD